MRTARELKKYMEDLKIVEKISREKHILETIENSLISQNGIYSICNYVLTEKEIKNKETSWGLFENNMYNQLSDQIIVKLTNLGYKITTEVFDITYYNVNTKKGFFRCFDKQVRVNIKTAPCVILTISVE
jgi:hypothetical protein